MNAIPDGAFGTVVELNAMDRLGWIELDEGGRVRFGGTALDGFVEMPAPGTRVRVMGTKPGFRSAVAAVRVVPGDFETQAEKVGKGSVEPALHPVAAALAEGRWRPGLDPSAVHARLQWLGERRGPPPALVEWFEAFDGSEGETFALPLAQAIDRRRLLEAATQGGALRGSTDWLPLVSFTRRRSEYRGDAAHWNTVQRELYVYLASTDGAHLLRADGSLEVAGVPIEALRKGQRAGGAGSSAPPPKVPTLVRRVLESRRATLRPATDSPLPTWLARDDHLRAWFAGQGGQIVGTSWWPEGLSTRWSALSIGEAMVLADQLLERSPEALPEALRAKGSWIPVFTLDQTAALVWDEELGLQYIDPAIAGDDLVASSRAFTLADLFSTALALPAVPEVEPVTQALDRLSDEVRGATRTEADSLGDDPSDRFSDFGASAPLLERYFGARAGLELPFAWNGSRTPLSSEALRLAAERPLGHRFCPLLIGPDGVWTCWAGEVGVFLLTPSGRVIPQFRSVVTWLERWVLAARRITEVSTARRGRVQRNMLGRYEVQLPLTPTELGRWLERLPWDVGRIGDFQRLTLDAGDEDGLRFDRQTFEAFVTVSAPTLQAVCAELKTAKQEDVRAVLCEDLVVTLREPELYEALAPLWPAEIEGSAFLP